MKHSTQTVSYACDELFNEQLGQQHIVVIGQADAASERLLTGGLLRQGFQVRRFASCLELDPRALESASLVLVFVSSLAGNTLYAQVGAILRQVGRVGVVPVVEYADQEKAAALLELGCVDYLLAPFSEAQLSALLRRQESASAGEEGFVSCSQAGRRLLAMAV